MELTAATVGQQVFNGTPVMEVVHSALCRNGVPSSFVVSLSNQRKVVVRPLAPLPPTNRLPCGMAARTADRMTHRSSAALSAAVQDSKAAAAVAVAAVPLQSLTLAGIAACCVDHEAVL